MQDRKTRVQPKNSASKIFFSFLIIFVLFVAVVFGGGYVWYSNGTKSALNSNDEKVGFVIEQGATRDQIASQLVENGIMDSTTLYLLHTKISGQGGDIKAGSHVLNKNMSIEEVIRELETNPQQDSIWVTIPEGKRYEVVAEILTEEFTKKEGTVFSEAEFLNLVENPSQLTFKSPEVSSFLKKYLPAGQTLEGFLYPETYAFETAATEEQIIEKMLQQFVEEMSELDIDNGQQDFYDALIIASIVDKESLSEVDRPNVASVFTNRVEIGMLLQSDATVNYALGKSERRPTYADIDSDSPYNTYKFAGLPPAPINSPRFESIKHSLYPPKTDYYYFIHEEDGTGHFGETENDHFRNVCKYLDKTC